MLQCSAIKQVYQEARELATTYLEDIPDPLLDHDSHTTCRWLAQLLLYSHHDITVIVR